jgi:hypothetical protein
MGNSLREFSRRLETLQRVCYLAQESKLPGQLRQGLPFRLAATYFRAVSSSGRSAFGGQFLMSSL